MATIARSGDTGAVECVGIPEPGQFDQVVDEILGNSVNRTVLLTALGIPQQIAFQSLTAQEQAVSSRVNISKFQDPKYITSLTDQYLLTMQQQSKSSAGGTGLTSLATQSGGLVV